MPSEVSDAKTERTLTNRFNLLIIKNIDKQKKDDFHDKKYDWLWTR